MINSPEPKLQQGILARRRLLQGTFAAPAVLTVFSGSAQAASSINGCLVRANASPITSGIGPTSADDVLFRYQLWGLVDNSNSTMVKSYWIKGADLVPFIRNAQSPFLASGNFQQFDTSANVLTGSATGTEPSMAGFTFQRVELYVVLRISNTGQLVGVGSATSGAPVSDSCWNSFAMGTAP